MRTPAVAAALLTGLAVAATVPTAADAALTVTSTDANTIVVRGDAEAGGGNFESSASPAGGLLTINSGEPTTLGSPNAAGCAQNGANSVTCDGLAGKTLDIDPGDGQAIVAFTIRAADAPGSTVVYHGGKDRDLVFGQGSTVPLTVTLGDGEQQDVRGGSAADDLTGGPGNDNVIGNDGANRLQGGSGNDSMFGGADADALIDGGPGEDNINGGPGADTMLGGSGDDTFQTTTADDGADAIDGGDLGQDLVSYATRTVPVSLSLNGVADDGAAGEGDNLTGVETLQGGTMDDTITGNASTNYLSGNGGNDTLDGGDGFDVLRGNAGDDTVIGRDAGLVRDDVACNAGADTAIADFYDSVSLDCETVDRSPEPPAPTPAPAPVVATPLPAPVADTRAPVVRLTGLPTGGRVTRSSLRKGLKVRIGTDEATRLDVRIVRSVARAAAVAPRDNLTLARVTKSRATGTRTVKLVPTAALLGRGRKTLKLLVVATDAAGNTTTVSRTLRLR